MPLIAKQFGFANGFGAIGDIVDADILTGWSPLETDFAAYTDQFFQSDRTSLNIGKPFPAIEIDLITPQRVSMFQLKVETSLTLGPTILIGSDNGASSPANTLQAGDVLLGQFTGVQICSNRIIEVPGMRDEAIFKRFLRFLQRTSSVDPAVVDPGHGPANSVTYDVGAGAWEVVPYSTSLTIETWGGGAAGGTGSDAQDGGATVAGRDVSWVQTSNGGIKSVDAFVGGVGGTSSGANTVNLPGGHGEPPAPTNGAQGYSGAGGNSPFGGLGGARIYQTVDLATLSYQNYFLGNPGGAPGAGGGGLSMWYPAGDVVFVKNPGGGAGGYSKHVVARGSGAAEPGDFIGWSVGNGGLTKKNGNGAQGRVRFSWT